MTASASPAASTAALRRVVDYLLGDLDCPETARTLADRLDATRPLELSGIDDADAARLARALRDPAADPEDALARVSAVLDAQAHPYLFHGTAAARLPEIAASGLRPGVRSWQWDHSGRAAHCADKLFLTGSEVAAAGYALAACPDAAVLRVRRDVLDDVAADPEGLSGLDVFVHTAIPPEAIEVSRPPLVASAWWPLRDER